MKSLPIRTKLLLAFLFFIAVPLGLLSTVSYLTTAGYYEGQVRYSADQAFDQTYQYLASKVASVIKASDILYFSSEVQTALRRDRSQYAGDVVTQTMDMASLDTYLASFRSSEDVYRVILWVPGWLNYAQERLSYQNLDRLMVDPAAARLFQSKEKVTFFPPETIIDDNDQRQSVSVVSLYRRIRDVNNIPRFIGVIQISLLEGTIATILDRARTTRGGLVFLRYPGGEQILPPGTEPDLARSMGRAVADLAPDSPWAPVLAGGRVYSVRTRAFPGIDWTLVSVLPQSDIVHQSEQFRTWLLVTVGLIAGAAVVLAWILARRTTRRLNALALAMTQVGRAEVLDHLVDGPSDEIGLLVANFRSMVGQIDGLLEAQYRAGQDLKSAELKALQAQINPHFLSNTLEMINWQALNKGVPEIAEVSRALARFYALSLNNGRDVVTLADEVAHTETYVEIQNRRFGHRIDLRVRVPKTYLRCEMPKILLQPLVENAILHGILERGEDRGGTITVSARRDGGDLLVTVADDGVGMDPARAASLLTVEPQAGRHGYGVKNIDQRVRLFAGEGHGLSFTSRPGRGTKAVLRLAFQVRNSVR